MKIAVSLLSADFARLGEEVELLEECGDVDWIHIDVMDGVFVPNLTIGPAVVAAIRRHTNLPLDVHLMMESPHRHFQAFADAGASMLTVHYEACPHIHRDLDSIRRIGLPAGVALNPGTPAILVDNVLDQLDLILVMTVNPGYGGQLMIPSALRSASQLRARLREQELSSVIAVDGGVNAKTIQAVGAAGADMAVVGSALFRHPEGVAAALAELRRLIEEIS